MGLASGLDGDFGDGRRLPTTTTFDSGVVVDAAVAPAGFFAQVFPLDATEEQPTRLSLVLPPSLANSEDLSEMSEPPLSLSRSSEEANLREALGDAGGVLADCGNIYVESDVALEHGRAGSAAAVFHLKGHGTGHAVIQICDLKRKSISVIGSFL